MQKRLLFVLLSLVTLALFSCSSNTVEGKIKQYFKDSIVPKLDDPSSLELVSISNADTITTGTLLQMDLDFENKNYQSLQHLLEVEASDSIVGSLMRDEYLKYKHEADSIGAGIENIKKQMAEPGHIIGYESKVTFRAKNAMAALVLHKMNIGYYPANEADKRPEHFTASVAKPGE